MAGYPDLVKRGIVRRFLLSKESKGVSDNESGKLCLCSKGLVTSVRRELIFLGLLPPTREIPIGRGGKATVEVTYQAGSASRGGYVFDETGKSIQKSEWEKQQRKANKKPRPKGQGAKKPK